MKNRALVRLLRKAVNAMHGTIPVSRSRKLALGFFILDGPLEWGFRCIYFDGPNHYLAAGNVGFGWGFIDRPDFSAPNPQSEPRGKTAPKAEVSPSRVGL